MKRGLPPVAEWAILALCAALPLFSLASDPAAFLADPASEMPVKLFGFEWFLRNAPLGGVVDVLAWPDPGPLNNPDPVGMVVTGLLRPFVGRVWAYDLFVGLQLFASLAAARALARDVVADRGAALLAAVAFVLSPLVLVYAVAGAVTDVLSLWPWPLAVRHVLRGVRAARARGSLGLAEGASGAAGVSLPPAAPAAERSPVAEAARAGAWVAVGFVACPYNALVFGALAVPGLVALPFLARGARPGDLARAVLAGALVVGVGAGGWALWTRAIVADPESLVSSAHLAATRHASPFPFLAADHPDRYVVRLADYVAVGKDALLVREAGSRYLRAYAPGFVLLALALLGAVARPAGRAWLGVAVFFALASAGPYLPLTADLHLSGPTSPVWAALWYGVPGTRLLLEPFRYAFGVAFALGLAAAVGAEALAARLGRWTGPALLGLVLAELALLSPVPVPLPTARLTIPGVYWELDRLLPPGAIVELPWFDQGSTRFERRHFLQQLVHGRPIADEVAGFPARYLVENQFTAKLLALERPHGLLQVEVKDPSRVATDRAALARDFVGVVVDPSAYTDDARRAVEALLREAGTRVHHGERDVWRLDGNAPAESGPAGAL